MKGNYKGILGLNTVKAFVIVMLSLAIIGVVTLVVLGSLQTSDIGDNADITSDTQVVNNETLTTVTETGEYNANYNKPSATCTDVIVLNGTNVVIDAGNYTVDNCNIAFTGDDTTYNNTDYKWSYTYTYLVATPVDDVILNTSNGITGFFSNAITFFSLLGVVVIILIISLVVVVVNRFGGEAGGSMDSKQPTL